MPVNTPEASLDSAVAPGNWTVPSAAAVTLNVLVPDLNNTGGLGTAFAFLKKNVPIKSPQLSDIRSMFVILATAPLVSPITVAPFTKYPKYCSSFANAEISMFNNFDVAE